MKTRCNNKNYREFHRYGGRGISYDKKWETLSDWATQFNIKRSTLAQRFYTYKWSIEKCLNR